MFVLTQRKIQVNSKRTKTTKGLCTLPGLWGSNLMHYPLNEMASPLLEVREASFPSLKY